jgi:hypothetical protein
MSSTLRAARSSAGDADAPAATEATRYVASPAQRRFA